MQVKSGQMRRNWHKTANTQSDMAGGGRGGGENQEHLCGRAIGIAQSNQNRQFLKGFNDKRNATDISRRIRKVLSEFTPIFGRSHFPL